MKTRTYRTLAAGAAAVIGSLMVMAPGSQVLAADKEVIVVNTAKAPVLTQDTDNPARQPFQVSVTSSFAAGEAGACTAFSVPASKMLVMEYVSGFGLLPLGQAMPNFRISPDLGQGLGDEHFFPSTSSAATPTHSFFVVGQATRLYAKGPSNVQVCADRDSHTATASFTVSVSGYLVNLP